MTSKDGFFGGGGSAVVAYGSNPDPVVCPPPVRAPSIVDEYASGVESSSATVVASVNSHFWPDARYGVEYGLAPCSLGGCGVAGAGSRLGSKSNLAVLTSGVLLAGLAPGRTYHYRFFVESGGGGPVRGMGGEVGKDGAEGTFVTAPVAPPFESDCPNRAFRTSASAALSDCRAYEMVSPIEKQGGDIVALGNIGGYRAGLDRSAVSGER